MATAENTATEEKLIDVLQFIARERNISFEMLLEAFEAALLTAYKRHFGSESNAIVIVDRQSGAYQVYHRRTVVEDVEDPKLEISVKEARRPYQAGDFFDEEVTPKDFGRIAAQTAKQVIVQRIREAERDTVYNKYVRKLNDLVTGTVQRYEQRNMYVTLEGRDEAVMYLDEQVPGEVVSHQRFHSRLRARRQEVAEGSASDSLARGRGARAAACSSSRFPRSPTAPSRSWRSRAMPGSRSKVAVRSNRAEVDPIGACLGPKSSRIANVTDNLRGEKVDIIRYDRRSGDVHHERLGAGQGDRRRTLRGRRRRAGDRSRLSALAGDRTRRAERAPGRAADGLAARHRERKRIGRGARALSRPSERSGPSPSRRRPPKRPKRSRRRRAEIDAELIRKLEEFRRERLGTDGT